MATLPVIIAPDPRLKVTCEPVPKVDAGIRRLMDDLLDSMHGAHGIGLAAPQVGIQKRIIVVDIAGREEKPDPHCLANPEILWASDDEITNEEGCLSLPTHYADVTRPARIKVRFLDRDGKTRKLDAEGLLATCIQHEMDHLEGILFVDHISALRRKIILRKLTKSKKLKAEAG